MLLDVPLWFIPSFFLGVCMIELIPYVLAVAILYPFRNTETMKRWRRNG